MNTCDTCKHWTGPSLVPHSFGGVPDGHPPLSEEEKRTECGVLGERGRLVVYFEAMGICGHEMLDGSFSTTKGQEHTLANRAALDVDYSGSLRTGPKFGCVHHEPKP